MVQTTNEKEMLLEKRTKIIRRIIYVIVGLLLIYLVSVISISVVRGIQNDAALDPLKSNNDAIEEKS